MMLRKSIVALILGTLILSGTVAHASPNDPAAECVEAKAKAAAKKAKKLLQALGKNIRESSPKKLAFNISKAQSKFTREFTKAESRRQCETVGDAAAIEAKVDAAVENVDRDTGTRVTAHPAI